ncbi:MAG: hypothetical protein RL328_2537, partial [Acidobacteriota bacterium]
MQWGRGWIVAAVLFALTALLTLFLAVRPVIDVYESHIEIGARKIDWSEIRTVDRVSVLSSEPWSAPLLLRLGLASGEDFMVFHAGDVDSCVSLLRHFYRSSRAALLDGVPYNQFWGEPATASQPPVPLAQLPRPRLLLPEDEDDVERMFQRLKAGGRLDDSGAGAGRG